MDRMDVGHHLVDRGRVAHVDADRRRSAADLRGDALGRRLVEVGDDHRRGVGREPPSAPGPDARAATGHQRDTALELSHGLPSHCGSGMRIDGSP